MAPVLLMKVEEVSINEEMGGWQFLAYMHVLSIYIQHLTPAVLLSHPPSALCKTYPPRWSADTQKGGV